MPNPYQNLKEAAKKYASEVDAIYRKRRNVGVYPKGVEAIDGITFAQTIKIGQRLGYDIQVAIADESTNQITIYFVDKSPIRPWELR